METEAESAACLPASLPAIFRSPALPMAVQLSSRIQILARDTDIYNCHSCLPKCETPAEQPNDFLLFIFFFKLLLLFFFSACSPPTLCLFDAIFSDHLLLKADLVLISC